MENPQAQMPQGQPGQAPEQMQQGQPQEGGQDQQMQQVMQVVQQALQQGAQPSELAAQLLQNQVPPELIMQVFVQLGMPQEEAQRNIEQAMQGGGQQPQGQGEEMMEGQASNLQEEQIEGSEEREEEEDDDEEEGQPKMFLGGLFSGRKNKKNTIINNFYGGNNPYGQSGSDGTYSNTTSGQMSFPSLSSEINQTADYSNFVRDTGSQLPNYTQEVGNGFQPRFGDGVVGTNGGYTPPAGYKNGGSLITYQNGSDINSFITQVQDMLKSNVDPREIMQQVQSAAQQGKISPEEATSIMEQLQGMQVANDPQSSNEAIGEGSQDPQQYDPNMQAPEQQMGMFGGNIKRNLKRAFGGPAIAPGTDSKNYAKDRTLMFTNSVKKDMLQATLNDSFPSLTGMAHGGNLPKAVDGFDVTKYKTADEAELAARRYADSLDAETAKTFDWKAESGKWKEAAPVYKENISYMYDPVTKQFKENTNASTGFPAGYNPNMVYNPNMNYNPYGVSPVSYGNPFDQYSQLYNQAAPWAKNLVNLGNNRGYGNPMLSGSNLPGGMNAAQFLGSIGGLRGLTPGMAGKVGDQNWRVTGAEKYKKGSIWKGDRVKGFRYDIDWGDDAAMAAANQQRDITLNKPNEIPETYGQTNSKGELVPDLSNRELRQQRRAVRREEGAVDENASAEESTADIEVPYSNPNISPEGALYMDEDKLDLIKEQNRNDRQQGREDRRELRQETRQARQDNRGEQRDLRQQIRHDERVSKRLARKNSNVDTIPEVKSYGGVAHSDLMNAIHLINRAFGGMIPQAGGGLEVGAGMKPVGFSTDANSMVWNAGNQSTAGLLPESMQKNDNIAVKPLPARPPKQGTVEAQEDGLYLKGLKFGQMAGASAQRLTNFANKFNAYDPKREAAQFSSLNAPTNEFANMSKGLYGQQGDMLVDQIGNNVLNPTNSNFGNQQFVALGGRIYALGGEYDMSDEDLSALSAYGIKFRKV